MPASRHLASISLTLFLLNIRLSSVVKIIIVKCISISWSEYTTIHRSRIHYLSAENREPEYDQPATQVAKLRFKPRTSVYMFKPYEKSIADLENMKRR